MSEILRHLLLPVLGILAIRLVWPAGERMGTSVFWLLGCAIGFLLLWQMGWL